MEGQGPAARRPAMVEWREHCLHLWGRGFCWALAMRAPAVISPS